MLSGDFIKTWGPAILAVIVTIATTYWLIRHDARAGRSAALRSVEESVGRLYYASLMQAEDRPEDWIRRFTTALDMCTLTISTIRSKLPRKIQPYVTALASCLNKDFLSAWYEQDKGNVAAYEKMQKSVESTIQQAYETIKDCRPIMGAKPTFDREQLVAVLNTLPAGTI